MDPAELAEGTTLFHEHVGRADIDLAVEELAACNYDGLGCIVDAATGRRTAEQVANLGAIAARSEVRVVMAGGYFEDIGFAIYPVRRTSRTTSCSRPTWATSGSSSATTATAGPPF